MKNLTPYTLSLQNGDVKLIPRHARHKLFVSCKRGVVWVTASGDPNDYIVSEGDEFEIDEGRDEVLLQSLSDTLELVVRHAA